jgi:regulator of sigma E protease
MSYPLIFCTAGLLIVLHELGHFLAAKRLGIPIARFSLGLGRFSQELPKTTLT